MLQKRQFLRGLALVITKSRCPDLSGKVIQKPGDEMAATLAKWLAAPVPQKPEVLAPTLAATEGVLKHWATRGEMKRLFGEVREQVGERVYLEILERFNVKDPGEFRKSEDAVKCYEMLTEIARSNNPSQARS